jgi:TctA family transporter
MLFGLLVSCVGIDNPGGTPRFTFGLVDLTGGVDVISAMVGMFAVSQVMFFMVEKAPPPLPKRKFGSILANQWKLTLRYPMSWGRGSIVGVIVGVLPGAGADMAAWISYAVAKRFSKEPSKLGSGHPEGLIEAGASNNSSLAGAWVPALLFGIPGDTITAIAIGVLYMKGLNPGPTLFTDNAPSMYALYMIFLIANLIMIPLGIMIIRMSSYALRVPYYIVMPIVLLCCAVGTFAITNSTFGVIAAAAFGLIGFVFERNGFPIAAMVLGIVMGTLVEQSLVASLIKSGGSILPFFNRPISLVLASITLLCVAWPILLWAIERSRRPSSAGA